jgi:hypothetical protein
LKYLNGITQHLLIEFRKFRSRQCREAGGGSVEMHEIAFEYARGGRGILAADDKTYTVDALVAKRFAFGRRCSLSEGLRGSSV